MRVASYLAGILVASVATAAYASDATADLEITGRISPRCSIDFRAVSIDHALTDGPGSASVPFSVDCNQRLVVNLQSLNGGLELKGRRNLIESPGFISFLPYDASFVVDAAGASPITFRSQDMRTGATGSIGVTPYKAKGQLVLSWAPTEPLIGGAYADVIEVRVSGAGETSSSPG